MDEELRILRDRRMTELAAGPKPHVPTGPLTLTDGTLESAVAAHPLLVVDVWAPWCGPCRYLGPILDDLARELAGQVAIGKLNADENRHTIQRYGITGIPTMLIFKDGQLIETIVGAAPKPTLKARFLAYATR